MTMSQFQPSIIVIKADCSGMEKNQQSIIFQARCFRVMQLKILKELLFLWEIAAACGWERNPTMGQQMRRKRAWKINKRWVFSGDKGLQPLGVGTEKSSNNQEICHYMARYQNLLHILKIKGIELQKGYVGAKRSTSSTEHYCWNTVQNCPLDMKLKCVIGTKLLWFLWFSQP